MIPFNVARLAIVATVAVLFSGCASEPAATPPPAGGTSGGSPGGARADMHRVPVHITGQGSMLVTAQLNEQEVVLLLDTGAQSTVLDLRMATQRGVKLMPGEMHSRGVGPGRIAARQGDIITLDFNGFPAQVRPTLQDFSSMINAHLSRGGKPIIGLLGFDVLRSYGAIVDVAEPALYLRKR